MNKQAQDLINIMNVKQSNLCLACDCTKTQDIIELIEKTGQSICLLKTHADIVSDWSYDTELKIIELKKKYNFIKNYLNFKNSSILESNCGAGIILDLVKNKSKYTAGLDDIIYKNFLESKNHEHFSSINQMTIS